MSRALVGQKAVFMHYLAEGLVRYISIDFLNTAVYLVED